MQAIEKAIQLAGGPVALAEKLTPHLPEGKTLSYMAVRQWIKRGVPSEYCIPIEKIVAGQVQRHELRPDIYPPEEYEQLQKQVS